MGQKIHPLGFRVGITKRHQAEWYARFHKHQYAQTLLEDRLLRQTLSKLIPELLQKKFKTSKDLPRISHIKIERGLIPYEIGIQIHAENCQEIKAAFDHLTISQTEISKSLKTEFVLQKAAQLQNISYQQQTENFSESSDRPFGKNVKRSLTRTGVRSVVQQNFRQRFLDNILIVKKGDKITRKFKNQAKVFNQGDSRKRQTSNLPKNFSKRGKLNSLQPNFGSNKVTKLTFTNSQKVSRFANLFVNHLSIQFATALQSQMKEWNQYLKTYKEDQIQKYGMLRYAPVGYNKKWSLKNIQKLDKKPVPVLMKLLKSLQKQALSKMESLRQDFIILGTLSKMKSFHYFQQIRFIKVLRQLIQDRQSQQNRFVSTHSLPSNQSGQRQFEQSLVSLNEFALRKKLTNIQEENRKTQLIQYLQNVVQKHRQQNLYLYLPTIADSRKYLKKIQKFTKEQVNFLFGFQFNNFSQFSEDSKREMVKNHVTMAIKQANTKNEFQTKLQDVFLKQFQKQRTMCLQNMELTPKISLKFYSVKPQTLATKASIVADAIVDSLEKRQAFRRVIKKAKEDLMKTTKVKGVKIQVAGRLNGAEIARSEWVRAGRVPLQTLCANIDYCYKTAQTIYGIIGVKVWIYKGYTKPINKTEKPISFFPAIN
jgi:ribosomal protein S3